MSREELHHRTEGHKENVEVGEHHLVEANENQHKQALPPSSMNYQPIKPAYHSLPPQQGYNSFAGPPSQYQYPPPHHVYPGYPPPQPTLPPNSHEDIPLSSSQYENLKHPRKNSPSELVPPHKAAHPYPPYYQQHPYYGHPSYYPPPPPPAHYYGAVPYPRVPLDAAYSPPAESRLPLMIDSQIFHDGAAQQEDIRQSKRNRERNLKQRIAIIAAKQEEDRTEEENEFYSSFEKQRQRKNKRSRERTMERRKELNRILTIPSKDRTDDETVWLECYYRAKKRKNEGDRMRRERIKKGEDVEGEEKSSSSVFSNQSQD